MYDLSKKPLAKKSSPQIAADQEMLRPNWWQIKKLFRPTYSLLFVCTIKMGRTRFPFNFVIIGLKIFYSNNQNVLQRMNIFSK